MQIEDAVIALSAIAQESRLRVFRLLVKAAPESVSAGSIAEEINIPPATLSFHLKEMANAGLIRSVRDGRSIQYSIDVDGVNSLMKFLTEDCCQGRPDLCTTTCSPAETKRRSFRNTQ